MLSKAERIKRSKAPASSGEWGDRLPPGQTLTEKFPILHEGDIPRYDMDAWDFRVFGEVEEARTFSYNDLLALPRTRVETDIHCVTRWSKFDTVWEGVRFTELLKLLKVKPEAKYVMVHADPDYDTNVPLEDLMGDDVLLAFRYNDEPLSDKHGGPLRLLVPHLYFWKSAKWIRGFEFMKEDRQGYWEVRGFHSYGDPFTEQRFSEDDMYMPEDEWHHKDYD
ncbi:sulfite oxidase-like oxidoreductase [Cohnella lubricantis]|uniref:Sulfite oxidase-like oxidoreductase n=1 Tax=Cohnella lubricantis TaxID=2163172 RepID=A0A841T6V7_9BACL|nr:sulfite oxidase-like oxidoreductase [Cohnella lubricantis]MBB6676622.1 sulfite oxidase-like oxidoreductase [Cohnella lubricantis]MBP2117367.1 DMSO/TMAO reductase YedYZ molybdopterin-dependent catalytic subunit [Cohnella lubricantis]